MFKNKKTTIIFDFDGTIADSIPLGIRIINELSKKFKYKYIEETELMRLRNTSTKELMNEFKIPFYKIPFIAYAFRQKVKEHIDELEIFEGMPELFKYLKNNHYTVGILTSNSQKNVQKFLERYQLDTFFKFIHSERNIFGKDKAFKSLFKKYALNPHEVLYIGDEVRDIEACKKVDVEIAAVTWGLNSVNVLKEHNPHIILENLKDFYTIL